ncbi:MAG: hypothetical protein GX259_00245 [Bacteroidales bacterium]|nr:hypothetical protein [Bacteroidales bacterium]
MKNIYKIFLLFAMIFLMSFSNVYSQKVNFKRTEKWQTINKVDGVSFYYKVAACTDSLNGLSNEMVLLKLENKKNIAVKVEWNLFKYYNGKCINCDTEKNSENYSFITLQPNSAKEGACFDYGVKNLSFLSKMLNFSSNTSELTDFELKNIAVSAIK